jgi:hypothetical protein
MLRLLGLLGQGQLRRLGNRYVLAVVSRDLLGGEMNGVTIRMRFPAVTEREGEAVKRC